ncbi:cytidine deaminase family protein [Streptomyces sp. NPDC002990]
MTPEDLELVEAATELARTRCYGENHSVAAVARAQDGRTVHGVSVYHFTGGLCAELVVLGAAAAQGIRVLDTIVAVGDRQRGVLPPCGRCRQVLLDLHPEIRVLLGAGERLRGVPVADLLPDRYVPSSP